MQPMVTLSRLKLIRRRRALTQQQLADKAGVNRVTIARLETGSDDPLPTTVRKLADALRVDPEELMGPTGDQTYGSETSRPSPAAEHTIDELVSSVSPDARRFLAGAPHVVRLVAEAERQIPRFFPCASLKLDLIVDPEYGDPEELFLGISSGLPVVPAMAALDRFYDAWWVPHVREAGGSLIIDLAFE